MIKLIHRNTGVEFVHGGQLFKTAKTKCFRWESVVKQKSWIMIVTCIWYRAFLWLVVIEVGGSITNKSPMGHIAHLRKQFKSINTYDHTITLIKRKKNHIYFLRIEWFSIWTNLISLHPRMLYAKIGWNWPSGSGEEDF